MALLGVLHRTRSEVYSGKITLEEGVRHVIANAEVTLCEPGVRQMLKYMPPEETDEAREVSHMRAFGSMVRSFTPQERRRATLREIGFALGTEGATNSLIVGVLEELGGRWNVFTADKVWYRYDFIVRLIREVRREGATAKPWEEKEYPGLAWNRPTKTEENNE